MNPKISIIVPVYKVEPYIHKCIDSILAQTFKDFELILVNDGSPDNCGKVCDEYAQKDQRVKVIHKENGGQASARNAALDIAKGDYIGFVDSDDWIEPDMYELLYKICTENKCDIANCTSTIYFKDRTVTTGDHPLIIHSKTEAMRTMLEGKLYDEVVWTKLFKRELLNEIRFQTGIVYEDTAFTYKVFHKAEKVCSIGAPKYHYIKRDGSTMDSAIKNIKIDAVLIYQEMYQFIEENYPELRDLVALKLANNGLILLNIIAKNDKVRIYKEEFLKVAQILNAHFSTTIKLNELPRNVKILLLATKIHPKLYKYIINLVFKRENYQVS